MNYKCTHCGLVVGPDANPGVTLRGTTVPGVMMGKCPNCADRTRTFRPVNREEAVRMAEHGKEVGMRGAEFSEVASGWVERADKAIAELAQSGERFTAETLTGRVGMPEHRKAVGARFNSAARKGIIRKVGFARANRAEAHRRDLAVWEGIR